jgi:dihydrofolate reductase
MNRPRISLIWAMDEQRLIGRDNGLPWQLPADMAWFRRQTTGKPVLMGRKTHESIGRPLPKRLNLVLTRQPLAIDGCTVVHSLDEALATAGDAEELMVMGGAEVYAATLPYADRLYITEVEGVFEGDAWFPVFDIKAWRETFSEHHAADEKNHAACRFRILERRG